MTSEGEMREAFEQAMAREGYELSPARYRDGTYRSADYAAGWAMWQAARVEAEKLRAERDSARRAKTGHFSPYYLLANARRIQSAATARDPNWVLAMNLFAVGSTTAQTICRENGIDPDATVVRAAASMSPDLAAGGVSPSTTDKRNGQ